MLVLSRRSKERLSLPDLGVTIHFLRIQAGSVKVGVDAPPQVRIMRDEVSDVSKRADATRKQLLRLPREIRHGIRNELHAISVGLHLYQEQMKLGMTDDARETFDDIMASIRRLDENELFQRSAVQDPAVVDTLPHEASAEDPKPSGANNGAAQVDGNGHPNGNNGAPPTILLAEDEANEREMLAGFLRLRGMNVVSVGDGLQAIDYLQGHPSPDCLVLDMKMPRCDGATVVRRVRADPSFNALSIVGVSGSTPEENNLSIGDRGVNRWIRKPVDPARLLSALSETAR